MILFLPLGMMTTAVTDMILVMTMIEEVLMVDHKHKNWMLQKFLVIDFDYSISAARYDDYRRDRYDSRYDYDRRGPYGRP